MKRILTVGLRLGIMLLAASGSGRAQSSNPPASSAAVPSVSVSGVPMGQLVISIRQKAKALESSAGMKSEFRAFTMARAIPPDSIRYSDYVIVRLIYEAARDAGFWNMHWQITDQPPNSDRIWKQWSAERRPSLTAPTAIAECDELSALFAFLVERAGVRNVGLFWPYPNHTVAVWSVNPAGGRVVRVVVPTSQIFLEEGDDFDTRKFDPWRQKTIYEYTRRDVADSFEIPKPLAEFFLLQIDRYAGASNDTLQRIRYLRDAVFRNAWSPEQAANEAVGIHAVASEDAKALRNFVEDMRRGANRR